MGSGLKALMHQELGAEVHYETTACATLSAARRLAPEVVLVVAPVLTVTDTPELAAFAESSKVVLVTKAENTHRSIDALRAGVRAVLPPDTSADEFISVMRMVIEGDTMVIPMAARHSLGHVPGHRTSELAPQMARRLTPREKEVLLLLTNGFSNAEIAEKLSVSMTTVRSHVHHLLRKLEVGSRGQAIAIAYETGLVNEIRRTGLLR